MITTRRTAFDGRNWIKKYVVRTSIWFRVNDCDGGILLMVYSNKIYWYLVRFMVILKCSGLYSFEVIYKHSTTIPNPLINVICNATRGPNITRMPILLHTFEFRGENDQSGRSSRFRSYTMMWTALMPGRWIYISDIGVTRTDSNNYS